MIASLLRLASSEVSGRVRRGLGRRGSDDEGRSVSREVNAPSRALVERYADFVGGCDTGSVPPHLFPQWAFPVALDALRVDEAIAGGLNGECHVRVHRSIPIGASLEVRARLDRIERGERITRMHLETETYCEGALAIAADLTFVVPKRAKAKKKTEQAAATQSSKATRTATKPSVPDEAERVATLEMGARDSVDYAFLTGDFNLVHWAKPVARAMGFKNVILHGFATMARSWAALERNGQPVDELHVRFTKPVVLPGQTALYRVGERIFVGEQPGQRAALIGRVGGRMDHA